MKPVQSAGKINRVLDGTVWSMVGDGGHEHSFTTKFEYYIPGRHNVYINDEINNLLISSDAFVLQHLQDFYGTCGF